MRVLFKTRGRCVKVGDETLNWVSQKVNDNMFKAGKVVKEKFKESLDMFMKMIG